MLAGSPDKFQPKLYLARGCYRRRNQRGVDRNGLALAVKGGNEVGVEVGPVEYIEEFGAELDLQFLAQQTIVLEERKIEGFQAGRPQRVASEIAQLAERRKRKALQLHVLGGIARIHRVRRTTGSRVVIGPTSPLKGSSDSIPTRETCDYPPG